MQMTEIRCKKPDVILIKDTAFGVYGEDGKKVTDDKIVIIEALKALASAKRKLEALLRK